MRLNKDKRHIIGNQIVKVINAKYQKEFDTLQAEMIDLFWDRAFGEYENNPDMSILAKYGMTIKPETLSLRFYNPDTGTYDVTCSIRLQTKGNWYNGNQNKIYIERVIGLEMPMNKEWGSVKVADYDKYRLLVNKFETELQLWQTALKEATTTQKLILRVPELKGLTDTLL